MHKRYIVAFYRLALGLLAFVAMSVQVLDLAHKGNFNPGNFFSFFTIESNILAALLFTTLGLAGLLGKQLQQRGFLRGSITLYMAITGVVYSLLLAGLSKELQTTIPWVNVVLHYLMPVVVVGDWLIDTPRQIIPFSKALWWLIFPVTYVVYSLIRGSIVGWYPYPFLNPGTHGYVGVAVVSAGIAVVATAGVGLLAWSTHWRRPLR
jgi:hypothetical protein